MRQEFLSQSFEMQYMSKASYVIDIEIHTDRSRRTLGLSQKAYIVNVLDRF